LIYFGISILIDDGISPNLIKGQRRHMADNCPEKAGCIIKIVLLHRYLRPCRDTCSWRD
jgi:hypothetical protein